MRSADTPVPVPVMIASSDDRNMLGTDFFLMSRVAGRVFHDMTLADAPAEQRRPMYIEHARAMAALHAVDYRAIGLGDLERPGSFVEPPDRPVDEVVGSTTAPRTSAR